MRAGFPNNKKKKALAAIGRYVSGVSEAYLFAFWSISL
jgi:hypothetical protein